ATKTIGTEFEVRVADFCGRVLGPHATLADEGLRRRVARNICYAPGYIIMGGTVEILRNILGERVLGLPRLGALAAAPTASCVATLETGRAGVAAQPAATPPPASFGHKRRT